MIPFVLTGTVVPNATPTVHNDAQQRLNEYKQAIRHYLNFGPVYFIENSAYPLLEDPFFTSTPGLQTIQYPKSGATVKGKGYQEFEMLDAFVQQQLREEAFIKVTGRYVYKNIAALTQWITRQLPDAEIVIDRRRKDEVAIVSLFGVSKRFYMDNLLGSYRNMDDAHGVWAEHVLYACIKQAHAGVFLRPAPALRVVTGSMGNQIEERADGLWAWLRNMKRRVFWLTGGHELMF